MNPHGTPPHSDSVYPGSSDLSPCPPPQVWLHLVKTLPPEDVEAEGTNAAWLMHAAQCRMCGDRLATAVLNSVGEPSDEEAEMLAQMSMSSASGQRRLVARLEQQQQQQTSRFRFFGTMSSGWGWPAFAAAAVVVALAVTALWWTHREPSDASLLASAYNLHRLTELRLSQGDAVAMDSPTRGAAGDVSSSSLLTAKLRAQQRLETNPNDAALRQSLGRIALVEHNGDAALRHFEMAQALNPQLPGLQRDLGSAYFELAERSSQPLYYARAIDFFGQHLQQVQGRDSIALFDRGLAWERQSVDTEAIKDFEAALAIEKNAGWRAEIERHLRDLKARSAKDASPAAQLTPGSLLNVQQEKPGQYEIYLALASRQWLSRRTQDPSAAQALSRLADWGKGHDDRWLSDMLRVPSSSKESDAEAALSRALEASQRGEADATFEAATAALLSFKAVHNSAGASRAEAELAYAEHRRSHAAQCLAHAKDLQRSHAVTVYSSIRIYLELEQASCYAMLSENMEATHSIQTAALDAHGAGLPILRLRALGFAVEDDLDQKEPALAWKTAAESLAEANRLPGAVGRRYQILYGMKRAALGLDLRWTTAGLSAAAAAVALQGTNQQTQAYALEELGLDQARIGQRAAADRSFADADRALSKLAPGPTLDHYRADWRTDRARYRIDTPARLNATLTEFAAARSSYSRLDNYSSRLRYDTQYAELLRRAHRLPESAGKAQTAVANAEAALARQHGPEEREAAATEARPAYTVLVQDFLDAGDAATALQVWEQLRSAPVRDASPNPLPAPLPQRLTLVYARLGDRIVVWTVSDREPVRAYTLPVSLATVDARSQAFLRLCSDPRSSPTDLALLGDALYADLLAPFQAQLDRASVVQLDLDPSLAALPFPALQHHGVYFGLERPLLFLDAGWSTLSADSRAAVAQQETLPAAAKLLIVRQEYSASQASIPSAYDETVDLTHQFPRAERSSANVWREHHDLLLTGDGRLRTALPSADLLHYTGHGLNGAEAAGAHTTTDAFALAPHSLPHCRLAVLAACETLRERETPADDVPSFARILLRAGASHVLATQWDVDSRTTRDLMVRFYAELANHRTSPEALLRAQQSLHENPLAAHPYYWSPFQIVAQ